MLPLHWMRKRFIYLRNAPWWACRVHPDVPHLRRRGEQSPAVGATCPSGWCGRPGCAFFSSVGHAPQSAACPSATARKLSEIYKPHLDDNKQVVFPVRLHDISAKCIRLVISVGSKKFPLTKQQLIGQVIFLSCQVPKCLSQKVGGLRKKRTEVRVWPLSWASNPPWYPRHRGSCGSWSCRAGRCLCGILVPCRTECSPESASHTALHPLPAHPSLPEIHGNSWNLKVTISKAREQRGFQHFRGQRHTPSDLDRWGRVKVNGLRTQNIGHTMTWILDMRCFLRR